MNTRLVLKSSLINMRDLGGLPLRGGGCIRRGRVFRGASPLMATPQDSQWLISNLRLKKILDLRSSKEVAADGKLPNSLSNEIIRISSPVNQPLSELVGGTHPEPNDYFSSYCMLVPRLEIPFKVLLDLVEELDDGGVLVCCSAGKDRTGVLAALFLDALGVKRRAICQDYGLSFARGAPDPSGLCRLSFRAKLSTQEWTRRSYCHPPVMAKLLAWSDSKGLNGTGLAERCGFGERRLAALRKKLVTNPT